MQWGIRHKRRSSCPQRDCNQRKADMNLGSLNFQLPLGWQLISHHHKRRLLAGQTNDSPLKFDHRELDSQPPPGFCYSEAPAYTLILPRKPDHLAEVVWLCIRVCLGLVSSPGTMRKSPTDGMYSEGGRTFAVGGGCCGFFGLFWLRQALTLYPTLAMNS